MGAGNVKLVYARWADLDDAPLRLLAYMAVIALDEGDSPRFWGGRDALALAIGRMVADRKTKDPAEIAERKRAFKAVTRTLAILKDAGAITVLEPAAPGQNAVYALNLAARRTPLSGTHSGGKRTPFSGTHSAPKAAQKAPAPTQNGPHSAGTTDPTQRVEWTPLSGPMDPTQRDPEEYYEEVGLNQGGDRAEVATASHPPRAPEADAEPPSADVVEIRPGASAADPILSPAPMRPPRQPRIRGQDTIAEAMTRVAARRAAHQARRETS